MAGGHPGGILVALQRLYPGSVSGRSWWRSRELVGCFVLCEDFFSHTAAVVHRDALFLRPCPDLRGTRTATAGRGPAAGCGVAVLPAGLKVGAKGRAQLVSMCGVQINVVGDPVELETHGLLGFRAVKVIFKDGNQFRNHPKTLPAPHPRAGEGPHYFSLRSCSRTLTPRPVAQCEPVKSHATPAPRACPVPARAEPAPRSPGSGRLPFAGDAVPYPRPVRCRAL